MLKAYPICPIDNGAELIRASLFREHGCQVRKVGSDMFRVLRFSPMANSDTDVSRDLDMP